MRIDDYGVMHDKFELDEKTETTLAFPCNVCVNRFKTDKEEPCIHCGHNLLFNPDKE